jgi:hypothetical protein
MEVRKPRHPFLALGKALKAAVIAHNMRLKGIDHQVKQLRDEDVGDDWCDLGERLSRGMAEGVAEQVLKAEKSSRRGIQ